jgi:ABC-type nickel/cobalt efflux system permease component RcnA
LLTATAVSVAFVHTLIGPDHYIPFVAMSRARGWSLAKTLRVTTACGIGHVAGSVVVGMIGLALGLVVVQIERLEAARADTAAWLLIAFGLAYLVWGIVRGARVRPHTHVHVHADGTVHCHEHAHDAEHLHVHDTQTAVKRDASAGTRGLIPWALFVVFVFGPCEPLIPLLIIPAAQLSILAAVTIVLAFALTTIVTMTACVAVLCCSTEKVPRMGGVLERFAHAFAGCAVLTCGLLIKCGL